MMESERSSGRPTTVEQQHRQQLLKRKGDDVAIKIYTRRRRRKTSGARVPAAPSQAASGGSGPRIVALENSIGVSGVAPTERGGEVLLPCTTEQRTPPDVAEESPGSGFEVIVIESDDDEETRRRKDLEFEREIAALKAEIAMLEGMIEELESKGR